jgi:hypothetical protein
MHHGRLGTINWADRLAILTLDACHVQTACGGQELADIEGARSRSHGPWTGGGAARARTRRAGVYAPLDWDNLSGRTTRLLRLE